MTAARERPRVAWLYPSTGLLDGVVHELAAGRGADVFVFRVTADPAADLAVASLGEIERLTAVARGTRDVDPDAVAWACTAGSYIAGGDMDARQVEALSAASGRPATTTTGAIRWALGRHGARRVAVVTPYLPEIGQAFVDHLTRHGIAVVDSAHGGCATDEQISAITTDMILALAGGITIATAEAVVLPCTGLRAERAAEVLHRELRLPVVTANAATLDHALALTASGTSGTHRTG